MLRYICRRCGYECQLIRDWCNHHLEIRHQTETRASFLKWNDEENRKSLVVYADEKSSPSPGEVAAKFRSFSFVADFVYWVNVPRLFIVQLETSDHVDKLLQTLRMQPDELQIDGRPIQLRRKSDVLQNEWPILVGGEPARQGSSKDPICVELSDDGSDKEDRPVKEKEQNGVKAKKAKVKVKKEKRCEEEEMDTSVQDEVSENLCNGSAVADKIEDLHLTIKMSDKYQSEFLSKFKPEKGDDKRNVKKNLKIMKDVWLNIYTGFHNKLWPVCFGMANFNLLQCGTSSKKGCVFECSFDSECLRVEWNKILKKKYESDDEYENLIEGTVDDFFVLINNETECNRRLVALQECERRDKDDQLLGFTCNMSIQFSDRSAEATVIFSKVQGKNSHRKMDLVVKVFRKVFEKYEMMKVRKWSSSDASNNASESSDSWKQIVLE